MREQLSAGSPSVDLGSEQCKRPPAAEFPMSLPPRWLTPWHCPPRCHPPPTKCGSCGPQAPNPLHPSPPPRGAGASCAPTLDLGAKKRSACDGSRVAEMLQKPNPARQQRVQPRRTHLPSPSLSGILQLPPPQGTHSSSQSCCKGLNCAVKVSRVRKPGGGKCPCRGAEQLI